MYIRTFLSLALVSLAAARSTMSLSEVLTINNETLSTLNSASPPLPSPHSLSSKTNNHKPPRNPTSSRLHPHLRTRYHRHSTKQRCVQQNPQHLHRYSPLRRPVAPNRRPPTPRPKWHRAILRLHNHRQIPPHPAHQRHLLQRHWGPSSNEYSLRQVHRSLLRYRHNSRYHTVFSGGVIHIIDTVLPIPPSVAINAVDSALTALAGTLTQTNLVTAVDALKDVTVFAPSNNAFQAIGSAAGSFATDQLSRILEYHFIAGRV